MTANYLFNVDNEVSNFFCEANNIRPHNGHAPEIDQTCFIDPSAVIIGQVKIGRDSSIWCNSVARGDVSYIDIGERSNIQDLTMLHVTHYNPGRLLLTVFD